MSCASGSWSTWRSWPAPPRTEKMSVMTQNPLPPRSTVLYTTSLVWWMRLLSGAFGILVIVILALPTLAWLLGGDDRMLIPAVIVVPLLMPVLVFLVLVNLLKFTVTTEGVIVRNLLRWSRIPWDAVAVVEVDRSVLGRGATVIVRRDGTRVRSELTAARSAIRRGESTFDHGPDLMQPARPTRAAMQAHQEFLGLRPR